MALLALYYIQNPLSSMIGYALLPVQIMSAACAAGAVIIFSQRPEQISSIVSGLPLLAALSVYDRMIKSSVDAKVVLTKRSLRNMAATKIQATVRKFLVQENIRQLNY